MLGKKGLMAQNMGHIIMVRGECHVRHDSVDVQSCRVPSDSILGQLFGSQHIVSIEEKSRIFGSPSEPFKLC